jgi:hypothetical protein
MSFTPVTNVQQAFEELEYFRGYFRQQGEQRRLFGSSKGNPLEVARLDQSMFQIKNHINILEARIMELTRTNDQLEKHVQAAQQSIFAKVDKNTWLSERDPEAVQKFISLKSNIAGFASAFASRSWPEFTDETEKQMFRITLCDIVRTDIDQGQKSFPWQLLEGTKKSPTLLLSAYLAYTIGQDVLKNPFWFKPNYRNGESSALVHLYQELQQGM